MERKSFLIILLFFVSGILYYLIFVYPQKNISNNFIEENVLVKKVVDGDTLVLNDSRKVRLLGINTPEKGKFFSDKALNFSKILENKSILLRYKEKDKYGRILGYVIYEEKNINEELLKKGLAHLFVYEKDSFYETLKEAEEKAKKNELGIWKKSKNFGCLELVEFKYKENSGRCKNEEKLVLKNNCEKIQVLIKDDATHQFLENISKGYFEKNFSCIFNDEGDSLYIWDEEGLVLFYRYP